MRWRRVFIIAILAEALSVFALLAIVPIVIANGISTIGTLQLQLQQAALWVGPVSGFALCLIGGWWAGRKTPDPLAHGIRVGVSVAAMDLVLLVIAGAPLGQLMLTSVAGRLLGGYLGGRWSKRGSAGRRFADSTAA